jgi:hypothetical protein
LRSSGKLFWIAVGLRAVLRQRWRSIEPASCHHKARQAIRDALFWMVTARDQEKCIWHLLLKGLTELYKTVFIQGHSNLQ